MMAIISIPPGIRFEGWCWSKFASCSVLEHWFDRFSLRWWCYCNKVTSTISRVKARLSFGHFDVDLRTIFLDKNFVPKTILSGFSHAHESRFLFRLLDKHLSIYRFSFVASETSGPVLVRQVYDPCCTPVGCICCHPFIIFPSCLLNPGILHCGVWAGDLFAEQLHRLSLTPRGSR